MEIAVADMTIDELRPLLARELPRHAGFDGWSLKAVQSASESLGIAPEIAQLVFESPVAMIDAWFADIDAQMLHDLSPETLAAMKVRDRITALVEARIAIVAPNREALRRALAILAMPQNLLTAAKLGWRAADVIWRAAGDTATDYNHYTKRTILGTVYGATLTVFLNDESVGHANTKAFLARRIEGVMNFERAKMKFTAKPEISFSMSRFIGRLRYPA